MTNFQFHSEMRAGSKQTPTAVDLMRLPAKERRKLLRQQAKIAVAYYTNDPDINFEIYDDVL